MAEREEKTTGAPSPDAQVAAPSPAELRDVNERLLIAGLREQELAAALAIKRVTLEAERAQLAVILAGIGDAVLVVDGAGTPVRANVAYARMAGGAGRPLAPEDAQGRPLPRAETPQARAARGETFSLEFSHGWDAPLVRGQRATAARSRHAARRRRHPRYHPLHPASPPPG